MVEGVYESYDDILNSPKAEKYPADGVFNRANTVWVGDLKFKDINEDGKIDVNDRTIIGSPLPIFTYGWTNTFRYKGFDLSIFLSALFLICLTRSLFNPISSPISPKVFFSVPIPIVFICL